LTYKKAPTGAKVKHATAYGIYLTNILKICSEHSIASGNLLHHLCFWILEHVAHKY